ncbi:MAG: hypothetical protein AAGI22_16490, partial [Planctomycetota bacterium]
MILRFSSLAACAVVTTGAAFAQANDDCSGAIALTSGTAVAFDTTAATAGAAFACAAGGGPDLWYSYTSTMAGSNVSVQTCGSAYDTALEVFDGSCAAPNLIECNDDACGLQSTVDVANTAAGATYLIRVGGFNGSTGTGTIIVSESQDLCAAGLDDMFEDNDTCQTAAAITPGTYVDLVATLTDPDHYTVTLAASEQLNVA